MVNDIAEVAGYVSEGTMYVLLLFAGMILFYAGIFYGGTYLYDWIKSRKISGNDNKNQ